MADVTLHRIDLRQPVDAAVLSPDEQRRAARLKIDAVRRRFVAARAHLRHILAARTGIPPAALSFALGAQGKPALTAPPIELHFNLSHSEDTALIAVAGVPVGVDIERIRQLDALAGMMALAFTDAERADLEALAPDARLHAFFRLWTLKEAITKADGAGFRMIRMFSVPSTGDALRVGDFTAHVIAPHDGFAAAVAIRAPHDPRLHLTHASGSA